MKRDPLAERVLLDRSQRLARLSVATWPSTVEKRLAEQQEVLGDAWAERSTAELLEEISAEAVDIGAWAALTAQTLVNANLDADTVLTVGEMLARAVGAAAEVHACVVGAKLALRKATVR